MADINLVGTTFTETTGDVSYGFRMYDEYEKTYCNILESPPPEDDLELLQVALEYTDDISKAMFDFMREHETGLTINGTYYDWEEIADIVGD